MNGTLKWPVNTRIHIDQWVDAENQVYTFYEPIYPGQTNVNSFTDHSDTNETPIGEVKKKEKSPPELPY